MRVIEQFPQVQLALRCRAQRAGPHRGVHLGVATQTSDGLKVPVVHHAEVVVAERADGGDPPRHAGGARRHRQPQRAERLDHHDHQPRQAGRHRFDADHQRAGSGDHRRQQGGGAAGRPRTAQIAVRLMMNLSSSFDHRFIDGYDAAEIIQALKEKLEQPATIFIEQ